MIPEKVKSLHDSKQNEGEGSKAGEFNVIKGWLDNFRNKFGFKNVKQQEKQLPHQEAADEFPSAVKKITEEKGYLPEQIFNADESAILWAGGDDTKDIQW